MKNKIFFGALFVLLLSLTGVVYAGGPQTRKPFDPAEFNRFMADYPAMSQWLTDKSHYQGSEGNPWIMSGMRYDQAFNQQLKAKGWDAERFFYLLDHINMGLLTSQAEAKRDAAKVVLDQQREKVRARMADSRKELQEQMEAQLRSSTETAQRQWNAQRERVVNDPFIPPAQKQRVLAQLDRSRPGQEGTAQNSEEMMQKRRQAWVDEQKRQIMDNPNIAPAQKQAMVAQMQQSVSPPPKRQAPPSQEEMRAKWQAQQEQWINTRMQEVRNNPSIHPMQKQQMLDNFQKSLAQMKESAQQFREAETLIPVQENDLIKNNRMKLMQLFFPKS